MRKRNVDEMLVEAANRHLLCPSGMELDFIDGDLLLLMRGGAIAKRENGKWVVLEPNWSLWLQEEIEAALHAEGDHDLH